MNSRETMLAAIARNKPNPVDEAGADRFPLPCFPMPHSLAGQGLERFVDMLTGIGGEVMLVPDTAAVAQYVSTRYDPGHRLITTLPELAGVAELHGQDRSPHELADVELAVLRGEFGVAENGAIWLTESLLEEGQAAVRNYAVRATPFICQQLALVINRDDLVPTLHEAYERIGTANYSYGTFIAGPSKTADIEQSLVLGAHGPKGLLVFVVGH